MVPRCGYYIEDGQINRVVVNIEWNLGFDRVAKQEYVKDLHAKISDVLPDKKIIEVTSAAEPPGKWLSPIYVKFQGGESMEDVWARLTKAHDDVLVYDTFMWKIPYDWRAFTHYYCYYADVKLNTIRNYDVFTDVFFNPDKATSTQALGCACLKLLDMQGKLDVRKSLLGFVSWLDEYVKI